MRAARCRYVDAENRAGARLWARYACGLEAPLDAVPDGTLAAQGYAGRPCLPHAVLCCGCATEAGKAGKCRHGMMTCQAERCPHTGRRAGHSAAQQCLHIQLGVKRLPPAL